MTKSLVFLVGLFWLFTASAAQFDVAAKAYEDGEYEQALLLLNAVDKKFGRTPRAESLRVLALTALGRAREALSSVLVYERLTAGLDLDENEAHADILNLKEELRWQVSEERRQKQDSMQQERLNEAELVLSAVVVSAEGQQQDRTAAFEQRFSGTVNQWSRDDWLRLTKEAPDVAFVKDRMVAQGKRAARWSELKREKAIADTNAAVVEKEYLKVIREQMTIGSSGGIELSLRAEEASCRAGRSDIYCRGIPRYRRDLARAKSLERQHSELERDRERARSLAASLEKESGELESQLLALDDGTQQTVIDEIRVKHENKRKVMEAARTQEARKAAPGIELQDCVDCPIMITHETVNFAVGKYEVTQGQWRALMGRNPSNFDDCGDDCPVEDVSYEDVQEYIQRLNKTTGMQYRLPTLNELLSVCEAHGHGDCANMRARKPGFQLDEIAWHAGNAGRKTHPVGKKRASHWGAHDIFGNVAEWLDCEDECQSKYRRFGYGSWNDSRDIMEIIRSREADDEFDYVGFRLARSVAR